MRVIVQRVNYAKCIINNELKSEINQGFLLLVGFSSNDKEDVIPKVVRKIVNLRIFEDKAGKMNLSLKDVDGKILSISQFTLYASVKNGFRPSFSLAMNQNDASLLYDKFNQMLEEELNDKIETGIFHEYMKLDFENDGPCTIIIDSDEL